MEQWEIDFKWLEVRHQIKETFGKEELPDLNALLFIIGIQESGKFKRKYTKEEKRDLMHIAICTLLEDEYFLYTGRDESGWPHWSPIKKFEYTGVEKQEAFLKEKIIYYFAASESEE